MVIDSSALVAIILEEPDAARLTRAIADGYAPVVGAPTLVEATAVLLARLGRPGDAVLDALLQRLRIRVVPMTLGAAEAARRAYARYGKGVGDPGVLNFGDCLSYGVAVDRGVPLLFKGDDFSRTDIEQAKY
jgi:ribonuclease VapC